MRIVADEVVLRAGETVEGHVPLGPIEIGVREIDGDGRRRAAGRRVDAERTGVGEEIQEPLAGRRLADHPAGDAMVEKQARIEIVGEVDLELQARLRGTTIVRRCSASRSYCAVPRCRSRRLRKTFAGGTSSTSPAVRSIRSSQSACSAGVWSCGRSNSAMCRQSS